MELVALQESELTAWQRSACQAPVSSLCFALESLASAPARGPQLPSQSLCRDMAVSKGRKKLEVWSLDFHLVCFPESGKAVSKQVQMD